MATVLNERELQVLGAVIETYVQTAEPAGSRTIAKRFGLGVSAATIRNTMSDLEEKGYLYHPHTSAGRIPTDRAYRVYVDALMRPTRLSANEERQIQNELAGERNEVDHILARAAQVLSVLSRELGVAVSPSLDEAVLERLDLIHVASDRLMMVLTLKSGAVRTIYVEVPGQMASEAIVHVAVVLNERLAGLTLREIRATLPERLRDATSEPGAGELLNIFIQEADDLFDVPAGGADPRAGGVLLSSAQLLAGQPEFASSQRLQGLLEVTEHRDLLRQALAERATEGMTISIGTEHQNPKLASFTLVTSSYRVGALSGVIGVMGPTRMPYDKIVALVDHTSRMMGELLA
ncbi:MAG TPA: heat-inducible transcriptional repressor HrcA [Gemmatimonadales bacterium]|nr:heat-inducible transcriptional repressor HrcA [Gemmatimonadales bacterium]